MSECCPQGVHPRGSVWSSSPLVHYITYGRANRAARARLVRGVAALCAQSGGDPRRLGCIGSSSGDGFRPVVGVTLQRVSAPVAHPELEFLQAAGGVLRTDAVGSTAARLEAGGLMTGFKVIPGNGQPARAPELARALALAVVAGHVQLTRGQFVLTPAGLRALDRTAA